MPALRAVARANIGSGQTGTSGRFRWRSGWKMAANREKMVATRCYHFFAISCYTDFTEGEYCMERESDTLEYKEKVTDSFLKTVSAYANFRTGKIVFGVTDTLEIKGLRDLTSSALSIENKINNSLNPVPAFNIHIDECNRTVTLEVSKSPFAPYFYQGQAYIRRDSSTVPVDRSLLMDMILKDRNLTFDQLPCKKEDLTFPTLEKLLQKKIGLETLGKDTMTTFDLYDKSYGYTNAGLLFSSENSFPGVDIVRFGTDHNEILARRTLEKQSVLDIYNDACDLFFLFYSSERIEGMERTVSLRIPEVAFREALANALVHRDWSIGNARIQIAMLEDRIEIISPGGFPENMNETLYFQDFYSVPRNPHIAYVFLRLGLIERFGTGVRRILNSYQNEIVKPSFHAAENTISVTLPVVNQLTDLSPDQQKIYLFLMEKKFAGRQAIEDHCGFSRSKTTNLLNQLMAAHIIGRTGNSRSVEYFLL